MCEGRSNCNADEGLIKAWCSGGCIQAGTKLDVQGGLVYNVKKRAEDGKGRHILGNVFKPCFRNSDLLHTQPWGEVSRAACSPWSRVSPLPFHPLLSFCTPDLQNQNLHLEGSPRDSCSQKIWEVLCQDEEIYFPQQVPWGERGLWSGELWNTATLPFFSSGNHPPLPSPGHKIHSQQQAGSNVKDCCIEVNCIPIQTKRERRCTVKSNQSWSPHQDWDSLQLPVNQSSQFPRGISMTFTFPCSNSLPLALPRP